MLYFANALFRHAPTILVSPKRGVEFTLKVHILPLLCFATAV